MINTLAQSPVGSRNSFPSIDIVVPVFNEEHRLTSHIGKLYSFLQQNLPSNSWQIVITENGSTDQTRNVAEQLTNQYPRIQVLHSEQRGRGEALTYAWHKSQAEIIAYMDVDLATDLEAFPRLIALLGEGCDLAIGSRLIPGAAVTRCRKRELLSRVYNVLIRWLFRAPFTDAQIGFKAMRRLAVAPLLSRVKARGWFFDTELLLRACQNQLRIQEIPVRWIEDPDSRVKLPSTIFHMAWGLIRLKCQMSLNGHRS